MKILSTEGLTKLIQLIKNSFISIDDTVTTTTTDIKTINNTSLLGSGNIDTSEVFIAEYGVTPFTDIHTAYTNGKMVSCVKEEWIYPLRAIGDSSCLFMDNELMGTSIFRIAVNSSNTWTTQTVTIADVTLSNVSSIDSSSAVATALNGKANTDLSNLSTTGQAVIDGKVNTSDIWYDDTSSTLYIGVAQS